MSRARARCTSTASASAICPIRIGALRRRTIAYVFQFFNLLPTLSAAQNVAVQLRDDGRPCSEVQQRVEHALEAVGLTTRA